MPTSSALPRATTAAELRPLTNLQPWSRNYNRGDVDAIARSITRFGFNGRLAVHGSTVMAGNHALAALLQMQAAGADFPGGEGLREDADGTWSVLVTPVDHLTLEEAEAFAIADNRTRDLATMDEEQLAEILRGIAADDQALLAATGYNDDDLALLLARVEPDVEFPEYDESVTDELPYELCKDCGKRCLKE